MSLQEAVEAIVLSILKRRRKVNNVCEVISVNKLNNTCNVKDSSNFVIHDVRLLAVVDDFDKKFVVYPKVGSSVTISYLFETADKAVVIKYSEIDEIILNGDQFGGLVKIEELVTRLNLIESKLNDVIGKWNSFCNNYLPGSPTSVGTPATLTTQTETEIGETKVSDIVNEKVKHG